MTRSRIAVLAASTVVALGSPGARAEKLYAPSERLALPENRLELLVPVGPAGEGRHRFERPGGEGEALDIRVPGTAEAELVGERMWVGYTELKRMPPDPRTFVPDPEGPRVLPLEGIGPALFLAMTEVERVLGVSGSAAERVAAAVALLGAEAESLRRLAATELALDEGLWGALSAESWVGLEAAFAATHGSPYLRYRLLEAARGASGENVPGAADRAAAWARSVLASADLSPDAASFEPAAQLVALEALAAHGAPEDVAVVIRALATTHPGVGRQAVWTLRDLAPERLVESAPELLAGGGLAPETARVLEAVADRLASAGG